MIYYQLKMIYLPGKNDLFAKQKWFILNHKTLGTIQLFWQAVLRINHLNGSHHSYNLQDELVKFDDVTDQVFKTTLYGFIGNLVSPETSSNPCPSLMSFV